MAALDRESPDERNRYLDEACGDDRELRRRVDALLQSYADSGSFLERPVLADEKTLGLNPATDPAGPRPPVDDQPDLPDPNSDPLSLDFLQPSDSPDSLGRLGQYEVREVVGRGGMGVVLKANDTKLNRIVAVKVLAPELASSAAARKRFVREARAVAAVSHQHVVTIYAVEDDQLPYLAMEFIDGQSLQEKIDRQGQFPLREILRIGRQIAAGLAAAHGQGIIHRDIKPANILLQNGIERVQITDFGLARAVDDVAITRPGEVAGTPQFMSPEQAQGQPVDQRSDLFSLGSVLYTMCTGRPPFRADTTVAILRRICDDTARPIREVNPDVPEWLVEIVERLLAKQPEDRFETAAEVAELLGRHLAHVQDPGSTPFPGRLSAAERRPVGRARRRRFWLAAAIILLTVVGSLGLTEATGVTQLTASVIRVVTGEGTLVIEVDDPQVGITIDGDDLVITGAGPQEVRLKPGQYRVQATSGGQLVKQELVTIQRGGRRVVSVSLEDAQGSTAQIGGTDAGWVSLFNGRDLTGWKTHPDRPAGWTVEDGILVGRSGRGSYLFSERGDYEDLHLRVEAKINERSGSGVFCRSEFGLSAPALHPLGYEAVITGHVEPGQTGSLQKGPLHLVEYGQRLVPPDAWFTLEIISSGNRIVVMVNGQVTADCVDDKKPYLKGHIALQVLGAGVIQFRKIEIKELPPGGFEGESLGTEDPTARPYGLSSKATDAQRLDELSKSIEANPRDASLLEARGRLYAQLEKYDEAARDFIHANELLASPAGWDATSALFDSLMQHEEVFAQIAELRPDDRDLWFQRGDYYVLRGQWQRAQPAHARASDLCMFAHHYALVLLLTADEEGYRRLCRDAAAEFGQTDEPNAALQLARICSAGPQSGIDPARIVEWAQLSLRSGRNKYRLQALALACNRASQFDQAVTILQEGMDLPKGMMPKSAAAFPLALAHRGLGQEEEARKWYQIGVTELEWIKPQKQDHPVSWASWHWLTVNVWYREAKAVFEPDEAQGPKNEKPK